MSDGLVRYRFLSVVGEGGFGKVYRARLETSEGFHKDVAVKVLSDPDPPKSLLQRFRDEAKILGLVRDRAIVGAEPPIKVGDRWAVVMEYVDGVSLGSLIGDTGLEPGIAVEVVGEAARALHNAFHQEGPDGPLQLLHRDIKPDNIQVTPSGDVRILDFGIARANFSAREFRTRHSLGGTPGYIAPERLQGIELPVGDVFSLGVVLHEAITGVRPKYPPTVQWEGGNDTVPLPAERDATGILLSDIEIADEIRADPARMDVLRLAGWMRAEEPDDRPSARQVEEACRKLRAKLAPPYLRDWAETRVPHRNEIAPDNMIGQVLTTSMPHSVFVDPNVTPLSLPAGYNFTPPPQNHTPTLAISAVVGGLSAIVVGFLATGALIVVVALVWVLNRPPPEPVLAPATDPGTLAAEPVPAPAPATVTPAPAPAGTTRITPAPAAPSPAAPRPREIVVLEPEPHTSGGPPVAPTVAPAPVPKTGPTGVVVVATIPSGAVVSEKGKVLEKTGRDGGYVLSIGMHTLEIKSVEGEIQTIPVPVKKDQSVYICYDFNVNAKCAAQ